MASAAISSGSEGTATQLSCGMPGFGPRSAPMRDRSIANSECVRNCDMPSNTPDAVVRGRLSSPWIEHHVSSGSRIVTSP